MPRLTAEEWSKIRYAYEAGENVSSLARRFPVARSAIQKRAEKDGWTQDVDAVRENFNQKLLDNAVVRERWRKGKDDVARAVAAFRASTRAAKREAKEIIARERRSGKDGFVYIVFCEHASERWYKIGMASDFTARLAVIQTGCPLPVQTLLVGYVLDSRNVEADLHKAMRAHRLAGEWFADDPEAIQDAARALAEKIAEGLEKRGGAQLPLLLDGGARAKTNRG